MSHPAWGAWIEITQYAMGSASSTRMSHPAWGAWIEMDKVIPVEVKKSKSHPAWGAWIEI